MTLAKRLIAARRSRHMTQRQLADRAGLSVDLVRALEQGKRDQPRLSTLTRLAHALDTPVADLLGSAPTHPGPTDHIHALRQAIYGATATSIGDDPHTYLPELRRLYWQGRFGALIVELPKRVAETRAGVRQSPTGNAYAALAETLQFAGQLAAHLGHDDLAQVGLLQAEHAADASGDLLLRCAQASAQAWLLSRQGMWDLAESLTSRMLVELDAAKLDDPDVPAMRGELLHFGTIALARADRDAEAWDLVGRIRKIGEQVGGRVPARTSAMPFTATFAATSAVGVAAATERYDEVVRLAGEVPHVHTLPPSIRARYLLNVAFAQAQLWRSRQAVDTLRRAQVVAPELLPRHGLARATVEELMPRRHHDRLYGLKALAESLDA
jgi:transcriptional regulator with XRE-family HTH domain